jgi:amino-acid N-acetyltransferase
MNTDMDTPSKPISAAAISIRPAESGDRATIVELLSASRLVPLDETAQFGPQYAVAVDGDGMLVGVAGYERYGTDILLRSVAVAVPWRSTGIGARLTADRLAHASAQGCVGAYLLTDTARGYWERHGVDPRTATSS